MFSILPLWGVKSSKQKYIDQLLSSSRKCRLLEDKNKKTFKMTSKLTFSFENTAIVENYARSKVVIVAKAFLRDSFKNGSVLNQRSE